MVHSHKMRLDGHEGQLNRCRSTRGLEIFTHQSIKLHPNLPEILKLYGSHPRSAERYKDKLNPKCHSFHNLSLSLFFFFAEKGAMETRNQIS